ncbi:hypothetical protein EMMF5_005410 [Cystobasidiomycetes sp. EMM_F5]
MAAAPPSQNIAKMSASLSINDILSDLHWLPDPPVKDVGSISPELIPASSETVESSLAIAQQYTRANTQILGDSSLLDAIARRLDEIDTSLKDVESKIKPVSDKQLRNASIEEDARANGVEDSDGQQRRFPAEIERVPDRNTLSLRLAFAV